MKSLRYLLFYACIFFALPISAGSPDKKEYSIDMIAPSFTKETDVVVRDKNTIVEISNNSGIVINETSVITILNNRGRDAAHLVFFYNNFSEIDNIEIEIYDSRGTFIRKIKKDEIKDVTAQASYALFMDQRAKIIDASNNILPFTIRCSYRNKINGYITPPEWKAINHSRISIESATLTVVTDKNSKLLFKSFNLPDCRITTANNNSTYSWNVSGFNALPREKNKPGSLQIYPTVIYYTQDFIIDNLNGNFSSWFEFGNFYSRLNEGLDILNEDACNEIRSKIAGKTDKHEIIKTLYHWMQSQTRYVLITQGIGGWKSFDANYVYKNKYGDCKALVNYMKAILKVGGISANPVLISAGDVRDYFEKEMPYNYFNHVILSVPLEKDTLWLECTSQKQPFNYLGSFTSDRYGLMIRPNNSQLIPTPSYDSKVNRMDFSGDVYISAAGPSGCKAKLTESGELYDETQGIISSANENEKKDWLIDRIDITDFKIKSSEFFAMQQDSPLSKIEIELESSTIGAISGSRIFIHPKIFKGLIDNFPSESTRYFPVELFPEAEENSSISFHLPENYVPESSDKKEKITSDFADYEYSLSFDKNTGSYLLTDKLILRKKIIEAARYKEWLDFRNKVITLKNKTIVCKRA